MNIPIKTIVRAKKAKPKLTGTRAMVYCALFAAFLVVLSQVSFNIGVIPITLGLLGVLLCGSLLGARLGTVTVLAYIIMGVLGLPVFVGFNSSAAVFGPTGGYIVGYIFSAFLAGLAGSFVRGKSIGKKNSPAERNLAGKAVMFGLLAVAVLVCYFFGTLWYSIYTDTTFVGALSLCVFPFVPGDAIKIIICGLLTLRLKNFIK